MEIRCPIHGSMYFSEGEVAVLEAIEFQRLRSIKQLGFAEFSFPGGTHTRYLHSVGACHIAGLAFDSIFRVYPFSKPSVKTRFREVLRLATLLHDVGHGPLSHTTEKVMPLLSQLNIQIYQTSNDPSLVKPTRRANHEDYTIKFITESSIAKEIMSHFQDIKPAHVACLIERSLPPPDDFFIDKGTDFRPILSQIVSSELDADRMDYLERDSYFCGTNYGKIDLHWILQNLTFQRFDGKMYLALNRRALYTFDDFLISRHHMNLMVYCHHKSIIFEEMLNLYLSAKDCEYQLPAQLGEYVKYNDNHLVEHLSQSTNQWARRISQKQPYRVLIELHNQADQQKIDMIHKALTNQGIHVIVSSSKTRLSKYHSMSSDDLASQIYVVDIFDRWEQPTPIGQTTEIFRRYEGTRIIDRIYVSPENFAEAEKILTKL